VTEQATFCATSVDEWVRAGVTDAVVAPGSRSTPMALALAADGRLRVHVCHDERAAGFVALGLGVATGRPAVVLTTSGTAAAELHPAVVEAHEAGVPLLACTADRPPELRDIGAPQTIDQTHLFGRAARWFCDPGVPDAAARDTWRSIAARAVVEAMGGAGGDQRPGPVHLNLPFRDPLTGAPGPLPPGRPAAAPWHRSATPAGRTDEAVTELSERVRGRRGVIVAGAGAGDPGDVHALAERLGWPVLADPRSGCRLPLATTVAHADPLLRVDGWVVTVRPDIVLRVGAAPASKVVSRWLSEGAAAAADQVAVVPRGTWWDAERTAAWMLTDPGTVVEQLLDETGDGSAAGPEDWLPEWAAADEAAAEAIATVLAGHPEPTEPAVARDVVRVLPDDGTLVVASSMPIRDVEWYAAPRDGGRIVANRGANGIDGVVSTAVGVALGSAAPTLALVGDIAFLHDANALVGAASREIDLVLVVVNNDGGGIFSFLPQAGLLAPDRFECLLGTPHGVDVERLASGVGVPALTVTEADGVAPAVGAAVERGGVAVVVVPTDRQANVKVHDELNAAVAEAIS
jgi:2-succinyl-5-enolpyruvyl-6-hydroxy-3-cyclohexene-1-carboxylate synthase